MTVWLDIMANWVDQEHFPHKLGKYQNGKRSVGILNSELTKAEFHIKWTNMTKQIMDVTDKRLSTQLYFSKLNKINYFIASLQPNPEAPTGRNWPTSIFFSQLIYMKATYVQLNYLATCIHYSLT